MSDFHRILAIETSCDDTSVAIVEDGRRVLCSIIYSQTELHAQYGGVVPEAAAREHIETINITLQEALERAQCTLQDIDAFAATLGPGLIGSLLVGANTGKTLSLITGKPFLGVNHLYAHVASNYLESDLEPPFLCLLVSGGHTQLIAVETYETMRVMGETMDDAVGEAYDKVARLMNLPYPGGPVIDRLSATGNAKAFRLPRAMLDHPYHFSFSGLKTASLRAWEKAVAVTEDLPRSQADFAASFQHTVVETLFEKTVRCADDLGFRTIAIAGGVSANSGLRARFQQFVEERPEYRLYVPQMAFCTDNAAMVAACAYFNPITADIRHEVFSRMG
jgi:N6-L-threonylcarbamoyladenine synthase